MIKLFSKRPEFDPKTLPWADKRDFYKILAIKKRQGLITEKEGVLLSHWHEYGYVVLPQIIDKALIDVFLEDYGKAWIERPVCKILVENEGVIWLENARSRESYTHHHYRLMDFHNVSEAASRIMMHPTVIRMFKLIFDETPAAMQTLFFEYGSEQGAHQDFAYVHSGALSRLGAAWAACDDADDENGPLFYYPGSHRVRKYDFGNGEIKYRGSSYKDVLLFQEHLVRECEKAGLARKIFHARKGDVFLWHGALVHGGSLVKDKTKTRSALVSHYSDVSAYQRDRRRPEKDPKKTYLNGGVFYQSEFPGHEEWRYRCAGKKLAPVF